ncbi:ATP-dependent zinc protease family protein [Pseudolysinimonas sp.]|uniref:ATP-dependent zinc protease family protein n=1 Tax=Pseudolysinimonas sp. TaxID=2680009 RepID=UPI003F7CE2B9
MSPSTHSNTRAGWREWVQLPDIGVPWIKAKLDTGAQTSSLHASSIRTFDRDGEDWVRFRVRPWQDSTEDSVLVELPVHDRRNVRSSNGQVQERIVVRMRIVLLDRTIRTDVTLSNRSSMGFRMLIGRRALRRGIDVASGESYLGGKAPREARRRNRGIDES